MIVVAESSKCCSVRIADFESSVILTAAVRLKLVAKSYAASTFSSSSSLPFRITFLSFLAESTLERFGQITERVAHRNCSRVFSRLKPFTIWFEYL